MNKKLFLIVLSVSVFAAQASEQADASQNAAIKQAEQAANALAEFREFGFDLGTFRSDDHEVRHGDYATQRARSVTDYSGRRYGIIDSSQPVPTKPVDHEGVDLSSASGPKRHETSIMHAKDVRKVLISTPSGQSLPVLVRDRCPSTPLANSESSLRAVQAAMPNIDEAEHAQHAARVETIRELEREVRDINTRGLTHIPFYQRSLDFSKSVLERLYAVERSYVATVTAHPSLQQPSRERKAPASSRFDYDADFGRHDNDFDVPEVTQECRDAIRKAAEEEREAGRQREYEQNPASRYRDEEARRYTATMFDYE